MGYTNNMANKKATNRRPQTPKPTALRTSDPNRKALSLRNGDGPHKNPKAYVRTPKHRNQGWSE